MSEGPVDVIFDDDGDRIAVEVMGPNVYLSAASHGFTACVRLDADRRDRFIKAWAEAERQAEAAENAASAASAARQPIENAAHRGI